MAATSIPNRAVFRSQEVCEIAGVQPYVLRSWEAEFPDLGMSKGGGAARVYRRADVERVLRLKHLLFVEGLTLAGARRQMLEESPGPAVSEDPAEAVPEAEIAALLDREVRRQLRDVKQGLHWILGVLNGRAAEIARPSPAARSGRRPTARRRARPSRATKPVRSARPAAARRATRPGKPARRHAGRRKR